MATREPATDSQISAKFSLYLELDKNVLKQTMRIYRKEDEKGGEGGEGGEGGGGGKANESLRSDRIVNTRYNFDSGKSRRPTAKERKKSVETAEQTLHE